MPALPAAALRQRTQFHRRDPGRAARRPHGRDHGRRGPRERGRSGDGGRLRAARGHQFHGALRPRPDLPDADARALRATAPAADGQRHRPHPAHQFHAVDRGRRRRHHRHLGPRPRPHGAHRGAPRRAAGASAPARSCVPDHGAAGRRADARRTHRGGLRPGAPGRFRAGGRDRRDHER